MCLRYRYSALAHKSHKVEKPNFFYYEGVTGVIMENISSEINYLLRFLVKLAKKDKIHTVLPPVCHMSYVHWYENYS